MIVAQVPLPDADTLRERYARLTRRQREVFALLAEGHGVKAVARQLAISPKTADHHADAVRRELGVPDRVAVTRAAYRLGLLQP